MSRTDAGLTLVEVLVTVAITGLAFLAASRFMVTMERSHAVMQASAAADTEINNFVAALKQRWSQRQRPINPETELPGDFRILPAPALLRDGLGFMAVNSFTAIAGSQGFTNGDTLSLSIGRVNAVTGVRDSAFIGIRNWCEPRPASLNSFDYSAAKIACKCTGSDLPRIRINDTNLGFGLRHFPASRGSSPSLTVHSLAVCFSWPGVAATFDARNSANLSDVQAEIEAAYLGPGGVVKFTLRRVALPINMANKSPDALLK